MENTCFDITFCTGSGRRTHALQIAKNLYGAVASPVDSGKDSDDWGRVDRKVERCVDPLKSTMTWHLDRGDDKMHTVQTVLFLKKKKGRRCANKHC